MSYRLAATGVRRSLTAGQAPARRHSVLTRRPCLSATTGQPRALVRPITSPSVPLAFSSSTNDDDTPSDVRGDASAPLPPVRELMETVRKLSKYNQGNPDAPSSPHQIRSKRPERRQYFWDHQACRTAANDYQKYLFALAENGIVSPPPEERRAILDPKLVDRAFALLLRCKLKPNELSARVRDWERALGKLAVTPLTDRLSLRLLEANGKAGNIGRVLSLLEYRKQHDHKPQTVEFIHATTAVEVAGWYLRENRNIFLADRGQPMIDNPTRWLDAILLNMSHRKFKLDQRLAVMMLDTFSTRGRSGKAMHYFYSVVRRPVSDILEDDDSQDEHEHDMEFNSPVLPATHKKPYQVRLKMKNPPPFYKIPTEMEGKLLSVAPKKSKSKEEGEPQTGDKPPGVLKLDRESDPDWSLPLTAAFSFADSLTHGACGHDPIQLDVAGYNVLIKACVYRGALWRAMHVLDTVMPTAGIAPDHRSYDQLLSGLSRVGDVTMMRDYYQRMLSNGIPPSYYTVQCIVDGLLNLGDVASAITVIQDFFNQHNVLPPIKTQLKVLEFALGLDMIYEAKRHVYFIQQLWKWQPHYQYESKEHIYMMKTYQQDPQISKEALKHLFKYFGAKLDESDFF